MEGWCSHADTAAERGTQGGSLLALPPALPAPGPEALSFLRGHHLFRAEDGGLRKGEQPLLASRLASPSRGGSACCEWALEACTPALIPFPLLDAPFCLQVSFSFCPAFLLWLTLPFSVALSPFIHLETSRTTCSCVAQGLGR